MYNIDVLLYVWFKRLHIYNNNLIIIWKYIIIIPNIDIILKPFYPKY